MSKAARKDARGGGGGAGYGQEKISEAADGRPGARRSASGILCETPLLSMEQGGRSAAITHLSDEMHVRRQPL